MSAFARFTVGQRVKHPGSTVGSYPPGTGTIATIDGQMANQEFTYRLKCDKTHNTMPQIFKESQLEAVGENDLKNEQQNEHSRQLTEDDNAVRQQGGETPEVDPDANRRLGTGDEEYKEPTTGA